MAEERATTTYVVSEPFERALKSLRKVLADGSLNLIGELDMSSRFRERLLIDAAPSRTLFIAATPARFEEELKRGPPASPH